MSPQHDITRQPSSSCLDNEVQVVTVVVVQVVCKDYGTIWRPMWPYIRTIHGICLYWDLIFACVFLKKLFIHRIVWMIQKMLCQLSLSRRFLKVLVFGAFFNSAGSGFQYYATRLPNECFCRLVLQCSINIFLSAVLILSRNGFASAPRFSLESNSVQTM